MSSFAARPPVGRRVGDRAPVKLGIALSAGAVVFGLAAGQLIASGDSGSGDKVGPFESRVIGIGPQIGYLFPVGDMQGYVNLKAYGQFDARDRPSGVNVWLTFAISPAAPTENQY